MRVCLGELRGAGAQVGLKQGPAHQDLKQRDTDRPHVNLGRLWRIREHLGRHVLESACQGGLLLLQRAAPPEVCDLQHAGCVDEQVVGLDVAVQPAERVHLAKTLQQLLREHDAKLLVKAMRWLIVQLPEQVALFAQLHQHKDVLPLLGNVIQLDNVQHSSCSAHRVDLRVNLPLNAAQREIWSMHHLYGVALMRPAMAHLEHFSEGTPSERGHVRIQLQNACPCRWQRRRRPTT
mmetsp:Transcript_26667/g.67742  ORF Transcript_26667/g.67742 Transcript_26667/m.67742 type:complete len:235 (-) Transcript_26667:438-1142(-)